MPKILVIRLSSIGDIVLTTPVVRAIKNQLPGAELHYLTKPAFASILEHNPYIDKLIVLGESMSETIVRLEAEQYDRIVDLHHNARTLRIKKALGVPSGSFPKLNIQKWLLVNFKVNRLPEVHIVDRYFKAVLELGVTNDGKGLDYFVEPADKVDITSLPEPFRSGYGVFVIGAKHFTKRLPADRIIELIRLTAIPIVLLGGPDDAEVAGQISSAVGDKVYNGVGKFTLAKSASVVQQANVVITHDTGLMHIAAAFEKKIISIWGNTVPAFGMTPYLPEGKGESRIFEVQGLNCRPCSKIGFNKCPKGHFKCMNDQDLKAITDQVKTFFR
ncbi:MAG TPA: glycosyltransferase family 9 protein [Bacteroidia bacterium]|nr:glycosyltransferase family 9 protein [Bacteroidia bacterium]